MNVLVMGGTGYLGSKIVNMLLYDACNVVCTRRSGSDISRINGPGGGRLAYIPASADAVGAVLNYIDFDMAINMACNYGRSETLYGDVIEANIAFPLRILDQVAGSGTKRFITIGTGLPDMLNMYSFSKKMFSEFGQFYAKKHGIDFFNLRLEMFYGADEPKGRFIPGIISKMLSGGVVDVTLGTQHRDIIAVEDIVFGISKIMASGLGGYQEIGVGTGIAPAISELVDFIHGETGGRAQVHKGAIPMRADEPDCVADTSVLRSVCDWEPRYWKDGIREMICRMRQDAR